MNSKYINLHATSIATTALGNFSLNLAHASITFKPFSTDSKLGCDAIILITILCYYVTS